MYLQLEKKKKCFTIPKPSMKELNLVEQGGLKLLRDMSMKSLP